MDYDALGPLRHRCYACGKCCFGIKVELLDQQEHDRIDGHAKTLGIENAIVDNVIRFDDQGRCVFLGENLLCSIHGKFGFKEKPRRCQEYPIKAVQVEDQKVRIGVDPSCVNLYRSWQDGDVQDTGDPIQREITLDDHDRRAEAALINMSRVEGASVAMLLHVVSGKPSRGPHLPPGMGTRLIRRAKQLRMGQFLSHPEIGWGMEGPLAHLPDAFDALDPDAPPDWPAISADQDQFALEVMRRMLFLRYASIRPASQAQALLILAGAVLVGWADPDPVRFGEGISAWSRASRYKAFWLRMFPDPQTLMWVATGQGQPTELFPTTP
jgi:Fe-S-cluster containining protein